RATCASPRPTATGTTVRIRRVTIHTSKNAPPSGNACLRSRPRNSFLHALASKGLPKRLASFDRLIAASEARGRKAEKSASPHSWRSTGGSMAEAAMTPEASVAASTVSHPETTRRETSLWTRFAYGFGSVAFGVKDNGFAYFLLIFYSQVVGVDSRWVSAAISLALIFDAFTDPLVGYFSDNLRTRWGRRHPLMYAAA